MKRFDLAWDGHTHTQYCPHGSLEPTEQFIQQAIAKGFERYSLTEHMPFPDGFVDPVPSQDCAMRGGDIDAYFEHALALKEKYRDQIDVRIGFEIDFLPEFHEQTVAYLDRYAGHIDDCLFSVHFLQGRCIDYSPEMLLAEVVPLYGSVVETYRAYYRQLLLAITSPWGDVKPRRIGHLNLCRKFQTAVPLEEPEAFDHEITDILDALEDAQMGLDINVAGLKKPHCREVYVPEALIERIVREKRPLPLVYGSDTHAVKGVGQEHAVYCQLARKYGP